MAKMIADGFQRQPFGQEMTGTGAAQRMGTEVGSLDTQVVETAAGDVVEGAERSRNGALRVRNTSRRSQCGRTSWR
jgi:hypothetical protein